jgi:RNA polymerase sigma-70 factor (ECF subfamily)
MTTRGSGRAAVARALVRRSARGDRESFAALYDLTSAHAWRTARCLGADAREAEDVLERAYVDLWRQGADPRVQRDPVTWLLARVHRTVDLVVDRPMGAPAA